jgi:hypothetical protein
MKFQYLFRICFIISFLFEIHAVGLHSKIISYCLQEFFTLCLFMIPNLKWDILGVNNHRLKISNFMEEVQEKVAGHAFMTLIKQARNQAFKIQTGQPEAIGERYLGKTDIFGKKFDIDFMISTPNNFIEDIEQEIIRLRKKVNLDEDKE